MGYQIERFEIVARLSRHNSPRDEEHDTLWEDLLDRVREITSEDKYKEILVD